MKWIYLLVNVFLLASSEPRQKRIFNVFNLVTFQNGPCVSQDSKNGTCYTAEQCTELNGKSSGPCAQGYGVCCVFSFGCGQQTAQNNTYFESNAPTTGDCMATVCPSSNDICQGLSVSHGQLLNLRVVKHADSRDLWDKQRPTRLCRSGATNLRSNDDVIGIHRDCDHFGPKKVVHQNNSICLQLPQPGSKRLHSIP
eukprot:TCALIF_09560-PA protein Name:"Protein of unknown function" AED:0.08 eAED:0.08 QI:41/0.85/0.87/1/0/0.12/8/0/196